MKNTMYSTVICLLLLLNMSQAKAGLINVSRILIEADFSYLQIAEVVAWDANGLRDIALLEEGATVTPSSILSGFANSCQNSYSADCAIDGITSGNYWSPPGIYHGNDGSGADFLWVSLASASELLWVEIFGRTECCSDRDSYRVSLFDENDVQLHQSDFQRTSSPSFSARFELPNTNVPEPAILGLVGLAFFAMRGLKRS